MELTLRGSVAAVCRGDAKHAAKEEIEKAAVRENHGVWGDAHAGAGHRQVSLIGAAQVRAVEEKAGEIAAGAFGENFVIEDMDLIHVGMGSRIRLGEKALIEVTQIGKICHDRCSIYSAVGDCPMSGEGVFGRVISGGEVKKGDEALVERLVGREVPQCAIVVVSDRCSRGEAKDTAGERLAEILGGEGFNVFEKVIVPDDRARIKEALLAFCDERGADLVLTVGGTGLSPRDVTPEATREVIEKEAPGFSEAMRIVAMEKAPRSILSRGMSGVRGRTLVVNLPGSERGSVESLEIILPVLEHAIETLKGSAIDCGRE